MRRRYGPSPAMKPVALLQTSTFAVPAASSAIEPLTARGARVAARIPAHPARTPDARAEPGGYAACFSYVSPRRLGAGRRRPGLPRRRQRTRAPLPSSRTPQCFGVIFPAKVWVTIFPSFTTKVSVPHGYGCSVIGRGEAGDCVVEPEPVLEVRAILPRRDDLPCCVAALRSG